MNIDCQCILTILKAHTLHVIFFSFNIKLISLLIGLILPAGVGFTPGTVIQLPVIDSSPHCCTSDLPHRLSDIRAPLGLGNTTL